MIIKIICKQCKKEYEYEMQNNVLRKKDFCPECRMYRDKMAVNESNVMNRTGNPRGRPIGTFKIKEYEGGFCWDEPNILGY